MASKVVKSDGYNQVFGPGEACESEIGHSFEAGLAVLPGLVGFYYRNNIARRIVDVVPEEMVSPGFKVIGVSDDKAFSSIWSEKKLDQQIIDSLCWSRLFGGSAIMAMVNDNRNLRSPVREGAPLESVRVYDKTQITVEEYETRQRNMRYGLPTIYKIKPDSGMEFYVHYTRLHIIDGERIPNAVRKELEGWGVSVLSPELTKAIEDYSYCHFLATELLKRKQQTVWKAKDLAALCDDNEGMYAARLRLAQVSENSGVGKPIGIDADDEEYNILNSDINGISDFMVMKMDRIVELSGIHEIIIKNKNTGGVSASQNTALQTFYKLIERKRKDEFLPILEFLIPFLIDTEEWSIEFEPLSIPSDSERAKILKDVTDSLDTLIENQTIDAEESRETLESMNLGIKLKKGGPSLPTNEEVLAAKDKQQAEENDNGDNQENDS